MAESFDVVETLARILTEHGPLHEDDLAQRLRDSGAPALDTSLERFMDDFDCPAMQLIDERWVWLPTLIAGRVFTHRLDADEVAHDILTVTPDLDPITELCLHEQYARFADGSPARVVLEEFDDELLDERGIPPEVVDPLGALLLAPGTLAQLGAAEGDLVGVRLTPEGLEVEKVTPGEHAAVGALLAATLDDEEPVHFDAAVWTACVEDPAVFTEPLLPLSEIVEQYGLVHRGERLAPGGFDFDTWQFEGGAAALAERHDLDPDDAIALYTLVKLFEQVSLLIDTVRAANDAADSDEPPAEALTASSEVARPVDEAAPNLNGFEEFVDLVSDAAAVLADPLLAELLLTETIDSGREGAPALGLFADLLEPKVPRAARVAVRWLRAVALERMGEIDTCEQELLAAESMDSVWPLPLLDLARFASDRGDVERGLALLRRADAMPDHPLMQLLQQHRTAPRNDIGRNALCWCGSGRKYKKCHLGNEQLPLGERVGWLYTKASHHALLTGWRDELAMAAYQRCRHADDLSDALASAMNDPLVMDAVLFEDGAFAEFVELRGHLLPDDERLLAEQWLSVQRSVFEVEEVNRGHSVTVRDLRTGDTHEVQERTASGQLKPGQLICARAVPAGETMQFFGGIEPVALHERDRLIDLLDDEPDAETLIRELSRRFAPPELVNTEGDPLSMCESTVQVSDPGALEAALDDIYDRVDGAQPPEWIEHVNTDGMLRVRATLVLDGDTLRVHANSEARMDRVLTTVARLDPAMKVLADSHRPLPNARAAAELASSLPGRKDDALDPNDPEIAAMLDEFIRDYEAKWLDEPIPALDGYTPRQAAADPTRRGDLIKLLDSFPAEARSGTMDVGRLRAALGLQ